MDDDLHSMILRAKRLAELGLVPSPDGGFGDMDREGLLTWYMEIDFEPRIDQLKGFRGPDGPFVGVSEVVFSAVGTEQRQAELEGRQFERSRVEREIFQSGQIPSIEDISFITYIETVEDPSVSEGKRWDAGQQFFEQASRARADRLTAESNRLSQEQLVLEQKQLEQAKAELKQAENSYYEARTGRRANQSVADKTADLARRTWWLAFFTALMALATVVVLIVSIVRDPTIKVEVEPTPVVVEVDTDR